MSSKRKPFDQMTPAEIREWISRTREALTRKMQREQDYLRYRKKRGRRTPTDEAYEQDQILEADILAMLDEMEQSLNRPNTQLFGP